MKTKTVVDDNIADMFHEMISNDGVELEYAWPRYGRLHIIAKKLLKLASILSVSEPLVENFPEASKLIEDWVKARTFDVNVAFNVDYIKPVEKIPGHPQYDHIDDATLKRFKAAYEGAKVCSVFKVARNWLVELEQYALYITTDPTKLDPEQAKPHTFVNSLVDSWYPLDPLHIDFRFLIQNSDESGKNLLMQLLRTGLLACRDLNKELKTPDINVPRFVAIISEAIDKLRKIPELNRCQQAFSKIKKSVHLLETNFGTYYSDFLETNDSTIIMQNFVADVARDTTADAAVSIQFRRIMTYYKKLAGEQGKKDPKISALFSKIDEKFKAAGSMDGKDEPPDTPESEE